MWVVKLGGSLFASDHLCDWLEVLTRAGALVIVPGGGPFADQVRLAQQRWKFDESTAHAMALLAMEQFGRLLCGLRPGLVPAGSPEQIEAVLSRGATPVWMPTSMVMADPEIRHSWEVTSDSLSAWLTGRLGVKQLLLVKSVALDGSGLSLETLSQRDLIDTRFGSYLRQSGSRAWILAQDQHARFKALYDGNLAEATRILD